MLKHYLTIALRNLRKHPGYALINVLGLAVGLACCLLIVLFVQDELRFDRHHEKADRIYRVALDRIYPTNNVLWAPVGPGVINGLREFPEVEHVTRLSKAGQAVRNGEKLFFERDILRVDPAFFDVFTAPVVAGAPMKALQQPDGVVLTERAARKYFGENDPLGETLLFQDEPFTVGGLVADPPATSHFAYDFLLPFDAMHAGDGWGTAFFFYTYVALRPDATPAALEAKFPAMTKKYLGAEDGEEAYDSWMASGNAYRYFLQPLTDIHLHSDLKWEIAPNSDATYVYLFAAIALFILLIACINFMNLATARSAGRAREVGLRKVLGSKRSQLIRQFLLESILLTAAALVLGITLAELTLPAFDALLGRRVAMGLPANPLFWAGVVGFALGVGLLAGSYPAFVLSAFRPAAVLKGKLRAGMRGGWLRSGLVVTQFAISIALIAGTLVIYGQMDYMLNRDLGFDREHVVVVERAHDLGAQADAFKQEVLRHPNVAAAAFGGGVPGRLDGASTFMPADNPDDIVLNMTLTGADETYLETLGLEMAAGRGFIESDFADTSRSVLVNETAIRQLGWGGEDPVGKTLRSHRGDPLVVVGVVKDFFFDSLRREMRPLLIRPSRQWRSVAAVRVQGAELPATLAFLKTQWEAFAPARPFTYAFLDDEVAALYTSERTTARLFVLFAGLAVLIACLGLFGLAAYATAQRTKEIGVRKVLGASAGGIVLLLSKNFARLVVVAFVVAAPLAYFSMGRWLEDFAYRTELSWGTFALAGALALGIALLTVSYQALRAARKDPVESLRYE